MLSLILIVAASLFFMGIIIRTKSIASGRKGPGVFQPLKDIYVLFRKGSVYSNTSGFIFQIAPAIYLASILSAMLVVPFINHSALISFRGDFVFFAYMLAFGRFFQILSALDTGSSFEGMGANREALYSMLIEPAFFIVFSSFALFSGYTSFEQVFDHIYFTDNYTYIVGIIAVYLLIQIAMVENSRLPVDDPKTHLELTMVHEVMILDNSGFDLALIHIGTALKFAIYGALISNCLLADRLPIAWQIVLYFTIQVGFAISVGLLESFRARNRMKNNPKFLLTLSSIALLSFIIVLIISRKLL